MRALNNYIEQANNWLSIFDKTFVPYPTGDQLSIEQAASLKDRVEFELSPENLTCDGEASSAHIRAKGKELREVLLILERRYDV